jgi:hypothetical protein
MMESMLKSRSTNCGSTTFKSEVFVEGDNNGASNTDTWEGWVIEFLFGVESDASEGETIVGEPQVKYRETKLEMTETGLEGVGSG